MGAGMVGLGYGAYRLSQGHRDTVTTAVLTAGTSMLLSSINGGAPVSTMDRLGRTLGTVRNVATFANRLM